jgi:hypothetical protein
MGRSISWPQGRGDAPATQRVGAAVICGFAAVLAAGAAPAQAPAPAPAPAATPEYISIVQAIHVDRPPETVWRKVGGYCDLGAMLKISCIYTAGDGGIGTNRLLAGRINEVMVARTSTSYTYTQPLSPDSYHGTVEILPEGSGSKIIYTIFHDASALKDAAARDSDRARRSGMFNGVLKAMKAAAEGS